MDATAPEALPGQLPMPWDRAFAVAVISVLLQRTRRRFVDLQEELDHPELAQLRRARRRRSRRHAPRLAVRGGTR